MNIIFILIGLTVLISILCFQNPHFFEKYKFHVASIQQRKEYYRLLSAGFLHVDFGHLFFNMLTLYFFGPIVLQAFGLAGFLAIYIGAILLGNIFSLYIYQRQPWYSAVGASGGISGILFSAIAILPSLGIYFFFIPIPIPGYIFGFLYFSYSVYMMLNPRQQDNIGHAAHLGGAIFGLFYAILFANARAMENMLYIGIMAIPLLYMAYQVFVRRKLF